MALIGFIKKINIKEYIPAVLKTIIVISIISLAAWIIVISGLTYKLLEDKSPKSNVDDGKYILNRLTEDYEDLLAQKRAALDKETQFLLTEKGITQTIAEKNEIQRKLNDIQKEKTALNEEYKKNLIQREQIESTLLGLREEMQSSNQEMSEVK